MEASPTPIPAAVPSTAPNAPQPRPQKQESVHGPEHARRVTRLRGAARWGRVGRGPRPAASRTLQVTGTEPDSFGPMQQEAVEEEENKRYENEYETARREALGRMEAEAERRQLEDKLQAEALLQQMEELKVQEQEVRAPWPPSAACRTGVSAAGQRSPGGFSDMQCLQLSAFSLLRRIVCAF